MNNITIKDVARESGLSISTVSRVLNGNYPVSREAREKIERAIQELGYRPNLVARSLKSSSTGMLGVVVADIANSFFMKMGKGVEEVVAASGLQILFASSGGKKGKEKQILDSLMERRVDGLIIASSGESGRELNRFMQEGIPVIAVDRRLSGFSGDMVLENNEETAYALTARLLDAGHTKIAFNNVLMQVNSGKERLKGALKAMRDRGIEPEERWIGKGGFSREDSVCWTKKVFEQEQRPTAVICMNNIMTEGALIAFRELGLRVPQDVSVVSFGEISMQELIEPRIVCAVQEPREMGRIAGERMLHRLKNGTGRPVTQELRLEICSGSSVSERTEEDTNAEEEARPGKR